MLGSNYHAILCSNQNSDFFAPMFLRPMGGLRSTALPLNAKLFIIFLAMSTLLKYCKLISSFCFMFKSNALVWHKFGIQGCIGKKIIEFLYNSEGSGH